MPTAMGAPKKKRLSWAVLTAVVLSGFTLAAWCFFGRKAAPSAVLPIAEFPPIRRGRSPPGSGNSIPAPARTAAAPAGTAVLPNELRATLAGPPDQALAALKELAKTRPADAIDLTLSLACTTEEKERFVDELMQEWAGRDAQTAWAWLGVQSAERMDQLGGATLVGVVLDVMAARDPRAMVVDIDTLLHLGSPSGAIAPQLGVQRGLEALIRLGRTDLAQEAVEGWARDPLKPDMGATAYETVATALGRDAPETAGNWLRSLPASDERTTAIAAFTDSWADRNPQAALGWAEALAPAEGREAAIDRTVSDWVEVNAVAATEWLGRYLSRAPANGEADRLVETVINVSATVRNDPSLALQWAGFLSDAAKRQTYEEKTIMQWARQDPAAAMTYVRQSSIIPEDRKAGLIEQLSSSAPAASQADE